MKRRLARQAPHLTDHIDGLAAFALKMGGDGSVHLKWMGELHERFVGGTRRIRGQFFMELSVSLLVDLPRVKRSILFMQYSCPKEFARDKFCEWLSATEIKTAIKNKTWLEKARACEKRMEGLESEFSDKGSFGAVPYKDFQMLFARMESRVAQMLFGKKFPGQVHFSSMEEIAAALADETKQLKMPAASPSSSSGPALKRLKSSAALMDPAGRCVDEAAMLQERGVQVGVYVKSVSQEKKTVYRVVQECSVKAVILMDPATRQTEEVTFEAFAKTWSVVMDATEVSDNGAILSWPGSSGSQTEQHQDVIAQAAVSTALHCCEQSIAQAPRPDLQIFSKPKLRVMAGSDIQENALVLCPITHKLVIVGGNSGVKVLAGAVRVAECGLPEGKVLYLAPQFSPPKAEKAGSGFVEPFWAVRRIPAGSPEEKDANCRLETVQASSAHVVGEYAFLTRRASRCTVEFPVMVNSRKIQRGEELLWVDLSMKKPEKPQAPVFYKGGKVTASGAAA